MGVGWFRKTSFKSSFVLLWQGQIGGTLGEDTREVVLTEEDGNLEGEVEMDVRGYGSSGQDLVAS